MKWSPHRSILAAPAVWVLLEFARSILFSGLGWNLLAHTQWNWIPLIQVADATGVWGVSFLVVLVNVVITRVISLWIPGTKLPMGTRYRTARLYLVPAAWCMVAALGYGQVRLQAVDSAIRDPSARSMTLAVVQGNIPQTLKWDEAYFEEIWQAYEAQTRLAAKEKPDLIVWPETSVPGFLSEHEVHKRLESAVREAGIPLLVGVPTDSQDGRLLYNSAVLVDSDGGFLAQYDKIHLVPFGEYIPLKLLLGWLENVVPIGDFSPGDEPTVFRAAVPFSVLICFEDLFPGLARGFLRQGARAYLVITNDGWFKRSAASLQHLQASVFRAVEGRVWVVRAANTGWSGFVDPAGRRLPPPAQLPRFTPGYAVGRITDGGPPGPYARWGEWFLLLCVIMACLPPWKPSTNS